MAGRLLSCPEAGASGDAEDMEGGENEGQHGRIGRRGGRGAMRFVRTDRLAPGMVAARAVRRGRDLMLAANKPLTEAAIKAMDRGGCRGAYVYDEYSGYGGLPELIDEGTRMQAVEALESLDTDKVQYLANDIVGGLMEKGSALMVDLSQLSVYDQGTYEHSVNVALTATACGAGLGLSNEELCRLAAGALLHDCGKRAVDKRILNKPGKLTPEERAIMERHTQYGYDMLYNRSEIRAESRACALCHHENADGSGYPKGLAGGEIPPLAMIVHVADVYDALVKKRSYKPGFCQSEAVEYLMGGCGTLFDLECVRSFLKYIAVYPVGCDVELSDGRRGRVVANTPGHAARPTVVCGGKVLDLASDRSLLSVTVAREVTEDDDQEVDAEGGDGDALAA